MSFSISVSARLCQSLQDYETLQRDDDQSVARDYFHDRLEADFGDFTDGQLDIAISWGRHAELFAYDNDTGELYLED